MEKVLEIRKKCDTSDKEPLMMVTASIIEENGKRSINVKISKENGHIMHYLLLSKSIIDSLLVSSKDMHKEVANILNETDGDEE